MEAYVYYNLQKKVWSIKAMSGPTKGLVIGHAERVRLRNVTFKVSDAGRERVRREKRKNVHAGAQGILVSVHGFTHAKGHFNSLVEDGPAITVMSDWLREYGDRIRYNPYKYTSFVDQDGEPVHYRNFVTMNATRSIPVVRGGN